MHVASHLHTPVCTDLPSTYMYSQAYCLNLYFKFVVYTGTGLSLALLYLNIYVYTSCVNVTNHQFHSHHCQCYTASSWLSAESVEPFPVTVPRKAISLEMGGLRGKGGLGDAYPLPVLMR